MWKRPSKEIRIVTRRKQPGLSEPVKGKVVKRKAKRRVKKKKPTRDIHNPVKIVFQCYYGISWSGEMHKAFKKYLKERGLAGLFDIKQAGVKHTPAEYKVTPQALYARWRTILAEADFIVALTPELYRIKKAHVKPPEDAKLIYTYQYGALVPESGKPADALFDAILGKTRKRFNLVLPEKKK